MNQDLLSPPPAGSTPLWEGFRFWTNMGNPAAPGNYEETTNQQHPLNPPNLNELCRRASSNTLPLILNISLKGREYDHDLQARLQSCFPSFPTHLFQDIYESSRWGRGTAVLPSSLDERSIAFLANYPRVHTQKHDRSGDEAEEATAQVQLIPILCWSSSVELPVNVVGINARASGRLPVVVTISFDESVPKRMRELWGSRRRQERLAKFEQWAFLDLAAAFSGWPAIWSNARRELTHRHDSMYSAANTITDLSTTRIIHQDIANIIALREDLRLFIAAYAKYRNILQRLFPGSRMARINKVALPSGRQRQEGQPMDVVELNEGKALVELLDQLENRLQDTQQNLEHQMETSEVILRQLENLLSLAFNTQAVAQGQAMAMLNLMATVFLPLSFVASIFGMTQFEISPVWYPPAAFIILFLLAGTLLLLRWLSIDPNAIHLYIKSGSAARSKRRQPTFQLMVPVPAAHIEERRIPSPKPTSGQPEPTKSAYDVVEDPTSPLPAAGRSPDFRESVTRLFSLGLGSSSRRGFLPEKPIRSYDGSTNPPSTVTTTENRPQTSPLSSVDVEFLEAEFQKDPKPSSSRKGEIATILNVDQARITNWFQNRRAREKQARKSGWEISALTRPQQGISPASNPKQGERLNPGSIQAMAPGIPGGSIMSKPTQSHSSTIDASLPGGGVVVSNTIAATATTSHFHSSAEPQLSGGSIFMPSAAERPIHSGAILRPPQPGTPLDWTPGVQPRYYHPQDPLGHLDNLPDPGLRLGSDGPSTITTQSETRGHALQDYQMQLMLLEQQNKRRLLMAHQGHDFQSAMSLSRPPAIERPTAAPAGAGNSSSPLPQVPELFPASSSALKENVRSTGAQVQAQTQFKFRVQETYNNHNSSRPGTPRENPYQDPDSTRMEIEAVGGGIMDVGS